MNPSLLILVATLAGLVIGALIVYWIVGRRLDQSVLVKTHELEAAQLQLQHTHALREAALQQDGQQLAAQLAEAKAQLQLARQQGAELQQQLGFVTQDTQLFAGTIRENLLFTKPEATQEQLDFALSQASCESMLARSEHGIDTVIGEGGMKLSGGEKQRLSIARALIRNPRLLVFDEATSALDSITEEAISNTIRSIGSHKEHITVLIAHRLSTIMHADKIFVLEKGVIVETGKHEELLAEKGLYYAMWRQQIGERKGN